MIYQDRILAEARKFIGVREVPSGSNTGPEVKLFQATTGAYYAPWCASFVQSILKWSGYGTIANDSAGAYYIGNWCAARGWRVQRAQPADIVVYYLGSGHIGIVDTILPSGDFWAIEGNEGNAVTRKYRTASTPHSFYRLANVKPRPKILNLPRFEAVGSVNGREVVLFKWGKWAKLAPKIPTFLARGYSVRVKRRVEKVKQ